ncbi:MAG: LrgB family protein [Acidaminococcaceae bacterium]|nr:LrgB family protein [Acidaminococcaceae bacterium]MBR1512043.1 LrgB family protein [Acidaminococcaceae bacterium]
MNEFWHTSTFFGIFITLLFYGIGTMIKNKCKSAVFNPLLLSIIFTIGFLKLLDIDYAAYNNSAKYISYLMTPATICLAVPLYRQLDTLKKNFRAVMLGISSSVIITMVSVLFFARLFHLSRASFVTMLPKSITTPIGIGVVEELGGYVAIAAASIIISGILGNIFAEPVCKLFRIKDPIAKGIAIGCSSHALGTVKALEMGEVEGAMSSLSIALAGILTVVTASLFASLF